MHGDIGAVVKEGGSRVIFFFSSRRRHTRFDCDWSSDVCSSDLDTPGRWLASRLEDRLRAVYATGCVVSEPKVAPSGMATFLLQLDSIELEGRTEDRKSVV